MFLQKISLLFVYAIFNLCDSAFVDTLKKCSINDEKCQRELINSVVQTLANDGAAELAVTRLDPYPIENLTVSVLNLVELTVVKGDLKGLKDCVLNKFKINIEKGRVAMELTCDLTVKGRYKMLASSPLFVAFLGSEVVKGDGKGKVVIEKLHVKLDYHFSLKKKNEDLFIDIDFENFKYDYDFGSIKFAANNLLIGDQESSKTVVAAMNNNGKFIMQTFGRNFLDQAFKLVHPLVGMFFSTVPVKQFILEDLSQYADN